MLRDDHHHPQRNAQQQMHLDGLCDYCQSTLPTSPAPSIDAVDLDGNHRNFCDHQCRLMFHRYRLQLLDVSVIHAAAGA
jgi:hypothetical protein